MLAPLTHFGPLLPPIHSFANAGPDEVQIIRTSVDTTEIHVQCGLAETQVSSRISGFWS